MDFILEAKRNPQTTFSSYFVFAGGSGWVKSEPPQPPPNYFSSYFVFDCGSGWVKFRTTTTTKTLQPPQFKRRKTGPKNVASIILGGGVGTQLFPFTRRATTPTVPLGECYMLIDIPMSNYINNGINKIFVLTPFN